MCRWGNIILGRMPLLKLWVTEDYSLQQGISMTAKRLGLRLSLLQNLSVEALVDAMNPMSYQKVYMEGVLSLIHI